MTVGHANAQENMPPRNLVESGDPVGLQAITIYPALWPINSETKKIIETDYYENDNDPDGHLGAYNCIAYTLGYQDRWCWPDVPGAGYATKADFDVYYGSFGYKPSTGEDPRIIAVYGDTAMPGIQMIHGAIRYLASPTNWESKLGASVRIVHPLLKDLDGNPSGYGTVVGYYFAESISSIMTKLKTLANELSNKLILSHNEILVAQSISKNIAQSIQTKFSESYSAWRLTWYEGANLVSSDPYTRTTSKEFKNLVGLGEDIVPLLMIKLTDSQEALAIMALQRLADSFVVHWALDDPANVCGLQGRALATFKKWLATV